MNRQGRTRKSAPQYDSRKGNRTQGSSPMWKKILLAVRVFLLAILQVAVVSRLRLFGGVPDLILAYLVVVAVTGRSTGRWRSVAISGMLAGFLVDALGGIGFGVLALFYFLVGAFFSNLLRRQLRNPLEELLGTLFLLLPAAALKTCVTLLYTLLSGAAGFSLGLFFPDTMLPEMLGTLVIALPVFFVFRGRD